MFLSSNLLFSFVLYLLYFFSLNKLKRRSTQKPNAKLYLLNFILSAVPDCVSKNLVLSSLHFITDVFINKAQFNAGFSERLKLKDNAVPRLDPWFSLRGHYLFVSS